MNILMLNYEFPPIGGGAAQAHRHLLNEYAGRDDLHIDVLTASHTSEFICEQTAPNIRLYRVGLHKKSLHYWRKSEVIEWLFKASRLYAELTRENRYDLVHAFFAFPSAYLCLKTAGQLPYLVSLRGSDVPGFNVRLKLDYVLLRGLFRRIWKNAAAVIANSRGLAELAQRFEPSLDYPVIPNGVDTQTFSPPQQRLLTGRIKLLTVCRLIARKRIDLLIETVKCLTADGLDVELTIVGEGNLETSLKALARSLGVADRVQFAGRLEHSQLADVYRANHLFLMSSEHEGMSNAMLEALACGLPIITTDCEGTAELVADSGLIVDQPAPQALARAVRDLAAEPDRYRAAAAAARRTAESFSWAATAQAYIAVYEHLCAKQ